MPEVPPGFPKLDKQTRPWACKADVASCTRTTPCPSCRGRRNRRKGSRKQNEARKALGIPNARFASQMGHEERWLGNVRAEVKAGMQVKALATRFLACEAQSEAARPIGDTRPFVAVFMPDGWGSDGLFVCRLSRLTDVMEGLAS